MQKKELDEMTKANRGYFNKLYSQMVSMLFEDGVVPYKKSKYIPHHIKRQVKRDDERIDLVQYEEWCTKKLQKKNRSRKIKARKKRRGF